MTWQSGERARVMSPTWSRTGMALLAFAVALVADLGTKWLIQSLVMVPPRVIEVTPVLNLTLGFNPGVSFGLLSGAFADRPMLLAGITGSVAAGLLVWAMRSEQPRETLGLGLIAGGATGNLVDRVRQGAVTDFLDFHVGAWHWPAFNMADVAITVGVMLMIVAVVQPRRSPHRSPIRNRRSWQDLSLNKLGGEHCPAKVPDKPSNPHIRVEGSTTRGSRC
ncbi:MULTISPECIES: signal peptidase II [Hyphomicrobiales]|jgi:signal peptidase II|uniref:Lipoprotein signal peptidase n=2 Tax=Bosea TaxID=85413 RepID=A0ABW0J127_9HYPH